jgi:hypothetical protein
MMSITAERPQTKGFRLVIGFRDAKAMWNAAVLRHDRLRRAEPEAA